MTDAKKQSNKILSESTIKSKEISQYFMTFVLFDRLKNEANLRKSIQRWAEEFTAQYENKENHDIDEDFVDWMQVKKVSNMFRKENMEAISNGVKAFGKRDTKRVSDKKQRRVDDTKKRVIKAITAPEPLQKLRAGTSSVSLKNRVVPHGVKNDMYKGGEKQDVKKDSRIEISSEKKEDFEKDTLTIQNPRDDEVTREELAEIENLISNNEKRIDGIMKFLSVGYELFGEFAKEIDALKRKRENIQRISKINNS